MGRASGRKEQHQGKDSGAGRSARRRTGSHFTPMWLAQQVAERAIKPLLMWMSQDPEGWDRAHPQPKIEPRRPHPIIPGCYCDPAGFLRERTCPTHGIAAQQRVFDSIRRKREEEAAEADRDAGPLIAMLGLAVPAWIETMRGWGFDERARQTRDAGLGELIATKGDVLLYGSKRKGEQAEVFNAVAKGLAAAAYQPGGVRLFGRHWEATEGPAPTCRNEPFERMTPEQNQQRPRAPGEWQESEF